jgi:hypothetical protein
LSVEEKIRAVSCLVEGNSLRATTRMTGTHHGAIQKLLVELGAACSAYQERFSAISNASGFNAMKFGVSVMQKTKTFQKN